MTDQLELLRRLARDVQGHASRYTRAFGVESNAQHVLNLTDADTYALGTRMLAVLDTGVDPGDIRFLCWTIGCSLGQNHSGEHNEERLRG